MGQLESDIFSWEATLPIDAADCICLSVFLRERTTLRQDLGVALEVSIELPNRVVILTLSPHLFIIWEKLSEGSGAFNILRLLTGVAEEAKMLTQLCLHQGHLGLCVVVIVPRQARTLGLESIDSLGLGALGADLLNLLLNDCALDGFNIKQELEDLLDHGDWVCSQVLKPDEVGWNAAGDLLKNELVEEGYSIDSSGDPFIPPDWEVNVVLLIWHKTV